MSYFLTYSDFIYESVTTEEVVDEILERIVELDKEVEISSLRGARLSKGLGIIE